MPQSNAQLAMLMAPDGPWIAYRNDSAHLAYSIKGAFPSGWRKVDGFLVSKAF